MPSGGRSAYAVHDDGHLSLAGLSQVQTDGIEHVRVPTEAWADHEHMQPRKVRGHAFLGASTFGGGGLGEGGSTTGPAFARVSQTVQTPSAA